MSRELREQLESLQVEKRKLEERLAALDPEVAEAERVAELREGKARELRAELTRTRAEHRALEKATQRLRDNLPTREAQEGAERTAVYFTAGAVGVLVVAVILARCG